MYLQQIYTTAVHEKLFMVFMVASVVYMVVVVRLLHIVRGGLSGKMAASFNQKKRLLCTILVATIGLLFFFWRHRMHCQPKGTYHRYSPFLPTLEKWVKFGDFFTQYLFHIH